MPPTKVLDKTDNWAAWEHRQAGLTVKPTLCDKLPPLRLLLVMDNLAGHTTPAFVVWLFEHGVMPLYTPLSGSWLNMTESIQLANAKPVASEPTDGVIHSAAPEPAPASPSVADPRLWINGDIPVK